LETEVVHPFARAVCTGFSEKEVSVALLQQSAGRYAHQGRMSPEVRKVCLQDLFRTFSQRTSDLVGSSWSFLTAAAVVVVWAGSGPFFHFSDTWQLVINTGTTVVTFLMVFLIQNTQNRDAKALHLKLDELLRGVEGARTSFVDIEHLTDDELARLKGEFNRLHEMSSLPSKPSLPGGGSTHAGG